MYTARINSQYINEYFKSHFGFLKENEQKILYFFLVFRVCGKVAVCFPFGGGRDGGDILFSISIKKI